jgi:hypothetical protein
MSNSAPSQALSVRSGGQLQRAANSAPPAAPQASMRDRLSKRSRAAAASRDKGSFAVSGRDFADALQQRRQSARATPIPDKSATEGSGAVSSGADKPAAAIGSAKEPSSNSGVGSV